MANKLSFPSQNSLPDHNYRPNLQPPLHDEYNTADDYKASYDDLIDEYSNNSHHAALPTSPHAQALHQRAFSIPLKSPFSSKHSDDTHDTAHVVYPPQPVPKEPEPPGFWQKVSEAFK